VAVVEGRVLVVVGSEWVVLYDTEQGRTVSEVDHSSDMVNVTQCLYRPSLVPLPEPVARPLPLCCGEAPLLQHCPPADPYVPVLSSYDPWVVSSY
jgi:hypothetical protein